MKMIQESNSLISLLIDESTDNVNESKLLILVRYCDDLQPQEKFSNISKLSLTNADTIFNVIWNLLIEEGYLLDNLVLVMGDNAPTIQGCLNGVIAKFKDKISHIEEGRCLNHLLNLVIKSLIQCQKPIEIFKNFIYKLIQFFESSPKKSEIFKSSLKKDEKEIKSLIILLIFGGTLYTIVCLELSKCIHL